VKGFSLKSLWGRGGARLFVGDGLILLVFTALSLAFLSLGGAGGTAESIEVEVSGERVLTLHREDEGIRQVRGPLGSTAIEIQERRVRVLSSPCPLKLCQRAGWIGGAGEMLVCLPNEVVVRLSGRPPGSTDAVSR
jgi:hypothetical protein